MTTTLLPLRSIGNYFVEEAAQIDAFRLFGEKVVQNIQYDEMWMRTLSKRQSAVHVLGPEEFSLASMSAHEILGYVT
jgi:hypothetical protein